MGERSRLSAHAKAEPIDPELKWAADFVGEPCVTTFRSESGNTTGQVDRETSARERHSECAKLGGEEQWSIVKKYPVFDEKDPESAIARRHRIKEEITNQGNTWVYKKTGKKIFNTDPGRHTKEEVKAFDK